VADQLVQEVDALERLMPTSGADPARRALERIVALASALPSQA
jgi:hypothetical protein